MSERNQTADGRREFLQTVVSAAGLAFTACATSGGERGGLASSKHDEPQNAQEPEVTPGEDLMQEHGVIERILLIYNASVHRIENNDRFDLAVLGTAAGIIRHFVEDYHEKLEENFVFPQLEAAGIEVELTAVLRRQHKRGRDATDEVTRLVAAGTATPQLALLLRSFERMYRPHAAREDTVLFPAFRRVVGSPAYRELGEQFEDEERKRLGEHGVEETVADVARLEAELGIADLASFTVP